MIRNARLIVGSYFLHWAFSLMLPYLTIDQIRAFREMAIEMLRDERY